MAVKRATTTDDLAQSEDAQVQTVEQRVAAIEENSTPEVLADSKDKTKYVRLTGPLGNKTTVPESIVAELLESGFKKA